MKVITIDQLTELLSEALEWKAEWLEKKIITQEEFDTAKAALEFVETMARFRAVKLKEGEIA